MWFVVSEDRSCVLYVINAARMRTGSKICCRQDFSEGESSLFDAFKLQRSMRYVYLVQEYRWSLTGPRAGHLVRANVTDGREVLKYGMMAVDTGTCQAPADDAVAVAPAAIAQ